MFYSDPVLIFSSSLICLLFQIISLDYAPLYFHFKKPVSSDFNMNSYPYLIFLYTKFSLNFNTKLPRNTFNSIAFYLFLGDYKYHISYWYVRSSWFYPLLVDHLSFFVLICVEILCFCLVLRFLSGCGQFSQHAHLIGWLGLSLKNRANINKWGG